MKELADKWIFLDLDDKTGCDRWVAVAYLHKGTEDGHAPEPVYPCFNRMLVDAGHAVVKDFSNNEFNPNNRWSTELIYNK